MAAPSWTPGLAAVGAFIPTRTRERVDDDGYAAAPDVGTNTFTTDTTPTADQVTSILDGVCAEIIARCGTIPTALEDFAGRVAALGTAADVEITFPPDGDSPNISEMLRKRYADALDRLCNAAQSAGSGSGVLPVYDFPCWPAPSLLDDLVDGFTYPYL